MDKSEFLYLAEKEGFTYEFAESKLDAYLESRGNDAIPTLFVQWLAKSKESA